MSDFSGLKVKCPNCGRVMFETTARFDPDVRPNGSMVKSLAPYFIDWLCTSTTKAVEMCCPECLAPLAPSGVLNVLVEPRRVGEFFREHRVYEDAFEFLSENHNFTIEKDGIILFDSRSMDDKAEATQKHICPTCGKECRNAMGLMSHMRTHREEAR
jgi:predicted RNA-binding Zn-ribbon protein involved in translation (DUF1610 family)